MTYTKEMLATATASGDCEICGANPERDYEGGPCGCDCAFGECGPCAYSDKLPVDEAELKAAQKAADYELLALLDLIKDGCDCDYDPETLAGPNAISVQEAYCGTRRNGMSEQDLFYALDEAQGRNLGEAQTDAIISEYNADNPDDARGIKYHGDGGFTVWPLSGGKSYADYAAFSRQVWRKPNYPAK